MILRGKKKNKTASLTNGTALRKLRDDFFKIKWSQRSNVPGSSNKISTENMPIGFN